MRQLLGKDADWRWGFEQAKQFTELKDILASTPVLTPYSVSAETMISADASAYGIGAAILQRVKGEWKPVAYASRALTAAEKRYAQIEKEALAICWSCDKFHYYVAGKEITIETDHRPLLAILGEKELAKLPIRVQRFRLKMMNYTYKIIYTPGSKLVLADALSRSPVQELKDSSIEELKDSSVVLELMDSLEISSGRLNRIKAAMLEDEIGTLLKQFTIRGWPSSKDVPKEVKSFYTFREYLTCIDGILFYMNRVFIPEMEREKVLREIHEGHQGETKCIRRACEVVWWPGMSRDIRDLVKECIKCEEFRRKPKEPLITTPLPEKPWWRIAVDLFEKDGENYLVTVDYYSRYISVHELKDSTEAKVIVAELEKLFCMIGVPNTIVSDNGPQFIADCFKKFVTKWDIDHVTSSPKYPQSNGEAERAVQTVKILMRKNLNLQAALCAYRDTPLANGYSPSQLLFNRPMNSMGIMSGKQVDVGRLKTFEKDQRIKQSFNYNRRHAVRERSPIAVGQAVVVREPQKRPAPATVIATQGREVVVANQQHNLIRRNRSQVARATPQTKDTSSDHPDNAMWENPSENPEISTEVRQQPEVIPPVQPEVQPNVEETHSRSIVHKKRAPAVEAQHPTESRSPVITETNVKKTRSGRISKPVKKLNL